MNINQTVLVQGNNPVFNHVYITVRNVVTSHNSILRNLVMMNAVGTAAVIHTTLSEITQNRKINVIELKILGEKNIPELQALLMRCSDYLTFQDGEPVKKDAAKDLLISRPDNVTIQDKIVFGIYQGHDHSLIGVVDIIMRFAGPDILSLGLLVIEPTFRGKGIGEVVHKLLEEWARRNSFSRLRLGVLFDNEKGHRFWQRVGYKETGEIKPYLAHKFRVLEKAI